MTGKGTSVWGTVFFRNLLWALALLVLSASSVRALDVPTELKGSTVKVFAAYGDLQGIFSAFTDATGIRVAFLDMSSGEVLARLRAEKGKPLGDVWFGGGVDSFIAAAQEGLLEPYVSPEARFVPTEYRDPDGFWTGLSLAVVTFIVNTQVCSERGVAVPETWGDLLQPGLKGEILMSNPAISGTAYFILAGLLQTMGEEAGWAYLDRLHGQIAYYAKRGGEPPQKAALGEAAVALAPDTGEKLKAEGYPIVAVFPKDGVPWFPSPVAVLKGAENPAGAKILVDWALSAEGQDVLRKKTPRKPGRNGIPMPEILAELDTVPLMAIDFQKVGKERDRIVAEWQKRYGQP